MGTEAHSGEMCACLLGGCTLEVLLTAFVHQLGFLQFYCFATCVLSILGTCTLAQCHVCSVSEGEYLSKKEGKLVFTSAAFGPQPQSQTCWIPNLK